MTIYQFILFLCWFGFVHCNTSCPDVWVADRGSCYLFVPGHTFSFFEAQHYCTQHKGHLVVIDDVDENNFLKAYLAKLLPRNWWIGLSDELIEGSWVWYPTGESPGFVDWKPGEPTNNGKQHEEDCAFMFHQSGFSWVDISCSLASSPICEMEAENVNEVIG